MASSFIGFDVYGIKELQDLFDGLPEEVMGAGVENTNDYLVNVFQAYPPRVHHGEANPYQWQTEKQRKAFFATRGFGRGIPTVRTQNLRRGWKTLGHGVNQIIVNEDQAAPYTMGEDIQRGHVADGWKTMEERVEERMGQVTRRFEAGVSKAVRKYG